MVLKGGVHYIALDTETDLIGPQNLAPKLICVSTSIWSGEGYQEQLIGNGDPNLEQDLRELLGDPDFHIVGHNIAYDMAVIAKAFPHLTSAIFQAYADERIHCTRCREKVLNLSDTGKLDMVILPDGSGQKISYSLADLEKKYLGIDRSEQKEGDDQWRMNFNSLDGRLASQYPIEAAAYAKQDARGTLQVFFAQEQREECEQGPVSLRTSEFQAAADFALWLISGYGMRVDAARYRVQLKEIQESVRPEKLEHLIGAGVLRPEEPPRPYKNSGLPEFNFDGLGPQDKKTLLAGAYNEIGRGDEIPLTPNLRISTSATVIRKLAAKVQDWIAENPGVAPGEYTRQVSDRTQTETNSSKVKMTVGKQASINRKMLQHVVCSVREAHGFPIIYSNPDEPDPEKLNVSCADDVIEEVVAFSPVLEEYQRRQQVQKLITTELPRMCGEDGHPASIVHPCFDVLKETTRTSSYAGGKRKGGGQIFPSFSGQNVDPRVRPCYIPRDGWLFLSIDFSSIELVSAAQQQLELFGHSKLANLILEGVDLHAWMGAQLCYTLDENFRVSHDASGQPNDDMSLYAHFKRCQTNEAKSVRDFYKHWRKFAKPVDLGFPGGQGPATFVAVAKGYGVVTTAEQAEVFRNIWKAALPEFQLGFDWVSQHCKDPRFPSLGVTKDGKKVAGFSYFTPLGAYRSACSWTSAVNGKFLQSPTAEGAKIAVFEAVRACYDAAIGTSATLGVRPVDFIHDEILFEVPEDGYEHERAQALQKVMEDSMAKVMTLLPVKTEPALSRRWYKEADMVLDANGRLRVWEPKDA